MWNINTEVKVEPMVCAHATLIVDEQPSIIDFTVRTRVSLPKGTLPVSVRRKGSQRILKTYYILHLGTIFKEYNEKFKDDPKRIVEIEFVPKEGSRVSDVIAWITSHGVCHNVSWIDQHVVVKYEKVEDTPSASSDETTTEMNKNRE